MDQHVLADDDAAADIGPGADHRALTNRRRIANRYVLTDVSALADDDVVTDFGSIADGDI